VTTRRRVANRESSGDYGHTMMTFWIGWVINVFGPKIASLNTISEIWLVWLQRS